MRTQLHDVATLCLFALSSIAPVLAEADIVVTRNSLHEKLNLIGSDSVGSGNGTRFDRYLCAMNSVKMSTQRRRPFNERRHRMHENTVSHFSWEGKITFFTFVIFPALAK